MNQLISLLGCLSALAHGDGASQPGRVLEIVGSVTANGRDVALGDRVAAGALVKTGNGARVALLWGAGNVIHVGSDSELRLGVYEEARRGESERTALDLVYGKTRALIRNRSDQKKAFSLRTKGIVMGVRGTHVFIDSSADAQSPAKFATLEGQAQVSTPGAPAPILLAQGQSISIAPAPPPPAPGDSTAPSAAAPGRSPPAGASASPPNPQSSSGSPAATTGGAVQGGQSGSSQEAPPVTTISSAEMTSMAESVAPSPPRMETMQHAQALAQSSGRGMEALRQNERLERAAQGSGSMSEVLQSLPQQMPTPQLDPVANSPSSPRNEGGIPIQIQLE